MLVIYLIFGSFLFFLSLCLRPIPLRSHQGYALPKAISFLGTFLCVLLHKEPLPLLAPVPPPDLVASRPGVADLALLRFYDPSHFRAGNIHGKSYVWQNLIPNSPCGEVDLFEIIRERVRVEHFFRPFRGNFKGRAYDSDIPPPVVIISSATCAKFSQFVSDTIIQWVAAGIIAVWGPVDHVAPPYIYLVLPLTVEPTKPRLYMHDKRYLNLWIRDLPLELDHLCGLPRYALPHHFQTTFDDKNGYQHVLLHSSSQAYFGFQRQGFYFVFRTLPFDWKAGAFIYHRLGLRGFKRRSVHWVPVSQCIDDRHVGQLFTAPLRMTRGPSSSGPWQQLTSCVTCSLRRLFYWS